MIQIVFKPERAPVVRGESLYRAVFNRKDAVFAVRAKNAAHAELKVLEAFKFNLTGKTVDYDVESWLQSKREKDEVKRLKERTTQYEKGKDSEGGGAEDPDCPAASGTA